MKINCAEFETLLADRIDGTLDPNVRAAFELHAQGCAACAELERDAGSIAALFGHLPAAEPPRELLTRIAFQIPDRDREKRSGGWRSWIGEWFRPILQPRFAMGMAMTVLSFSMLGRLAGIEMRQLKPSDLHPVSVWMAVENRAHRAWDRAVKYYENLRVVYEVQTRLREWTEQEEEERRNQSAAPRQERNNNNNPQTVRPEGTQK